VSLENVTTMIFYSYCRLPEDRREGGDHTLGHTDTSPGSNDCWCVL